MKLFRDTAIALLSIGWMAPLCLSFSLTHGFLIHALVPSILEGRYAGGSFYPLPLAGELFYIAMGWLAWVILVWVMYLLRRDER